MVLSWSRCRLLLSISVFSLLGSVAPNVWVSVSNQLQSAESELTVPEASYLTGLHGYRRQHGGLVHDSRAVQDGGPVQDGGSVVFLATDVGKHGAAVYRIENQNISRIYQDESTTYFESVVYSPVSSSVFLTSPSTHSIIRISKDGEARVVFKDMKKKPSGLAIDTCTSTIYWSNTQRGGATIEAWQDTATPPDAIQSRVLISGDMARPRGISVDRYTGKLYWTDQVRNKFSIWRADLDGSGRELVAEGGGGEPFSLAVTPEWIYWSDWARHATWRINKHTDTSAQLVQQFKAAKPNGITYVPNKIVSCEQPATPELVTSSSTERHMVEYATELPVHPAYFDTYSIGDNGVNNNASADMCIEGMLQEGVCQCTEGWAGQYCEISLCHNFCLLGVCRVVEGNPLCLCEDGYSGDRCEIMPADSCGDSVLGRDTKEYLIFILPVICIVQFIIILFLSVTFHRYRKKPRIVRKRFISVSKGSKSKDKSTGSCGGLPTEDGIQLDIENCCNMTMCDTPCFEPPSRVPKESYSSRKSGKRSDKRSLLDDDPDDDDLSY